jgi:hypothetical protein
MVGIRTRAFGSRRVPICASLAATDNPALDHLLAMPPIAAKLAQIGTRLEPKARVLIPTILAACWTTALRPDELAEGRGTFSKSTRGRMRAASRALLAINFLVDAGDGRLRVNQAELERLRDLHQAINA